MFRDQWNLQVYQITKPELRSHVSMWKYSLTIVCTVLLPSLTVVQPTWTIVKALTSDYRTLVNHIAVYNYNDCF